MCANIKQHNSIPHLMEYLKGDKILSFFDVIRAEDDVGSDFSFVKCPNSPITANLCQTPLKEANFSFLRACIHLAQPQCKCGFLPCGQDQGLGPRENIAYKGGKRI